MLFPYSVHLDRKIQWNSKLSELFSNNFCCCLKIIEIQYLIAESDLNGAFARDLLENKELILYIL